MSQSGVECAIGRLLADGEFRRAFYRDPSATRATASLDLTRHEIVALLGIKPARLEALAKRLDPRIVRAAIGVPRSSAAATLIKRKGPRYSKSARTLGRATRGGRA